MGYKRRNKADEPEKELIKRYKSVKVCLIYCKSLKKMIRYKHKFNQRKNEI